MPSRAFFVSDGIDGNYTRTDTESLNALAGILCF